LQKGEPPITSIKYVSLKRDMGPISILEIEQFVAENIPQFHRNRIEKLMKLKLETILKRKNPYLFKA